MTFGMRVAVAPVRSANWWRPAELMTTCWMEGSVGGQAHRRKSPMQLRTNRLRSQWKSWWWAMVGMPVSAIASVTARASGTLSGIASTFSTTSRSIRDPRQEVVDAALEQGAQLVDAAGDPSGADIAPEAGGGDLLHLRMPEVGQRARERARRRRLQFAAEVVALVAQAVEHLRPLERLQRHAVGAGQAERENTRPLVHLHHILPDERKPRMIPDPSAIDRALTGRPPSCLVVDTRGVR